MSSGEGRAFFGKGCCENVRTPSGKEKEDWKGFSKVGCQVFLSKEIILGHPCIPRVRVSKGGDIGAVDGLYYMSSPNVVFVCKAGRMFYTVNKALVPEWPYIIEVSYIYPPTSTQQRE